MNKHKHANQDGIGTLVEDAHALMTATADAAGEKVEVARERVAAALENVKEMASNVRERAIAGANATDEAVRENPYIALGIGALAGALIGFLAGRRTSR
jgi:ElaB/YqjD/DUF883 family membrane-anchored ribosome-binding protein